MSKKDAPPNHPNHLNISKGFSQPGPTIPCRKPISIMECHKGFVCRCPTGRGFILPGLASRTRSTCQVGRLRVASSKGEQENSLRAQTVSPTNGYIHWLHRFNPIHIRIVTIFSLHFGSSTELITKYLKVT